MKFEVDKKALQAALTAVNSIASSLVLSGPKNADVSKGVSSHGGHECMLVAEESGILHIKFAQGGIVCMTEVKNPKGKTKGKTKSNNDVVTVHKAGQVVINAGMLASAVRVRGERFKAAISGSKLICTCGRSKFNLEVFGKKEKGVLEPPDKVPKATVRIDNGVLQKLFWATSIYDNQRTLDRTLHFQKKRLVVETNDGWRGIVAVSKVPCKKTGTVVLPSNVIDAFAGYLDDKVRVGWSDRLFVAKSAGFFVCVPTSSGKPTAVEQKMKKQLKAMTPTFEAVVNPGDVSSALTDVQNLVFGSEKRVNVDIFFGKKEGRVAVDGTSGQIESTFDLSTSSVKKESSVCLTIDFIKEAFSLDCSVRVTGYPKAIAIQANDGDGLDSYTALISQVDRGKKAKKPSSSSSTKTKKKRRPKNDG